MRQANNGLTDFDILLVDNKRTSRELTGRMLDRAGFHVTTAEDGQVALDLLHKMDGSVGLVLTELAMPHIDGLELMKLVKVNWNLPVMILSSKADESTVSTIFKFGADDFVQKPFIEIELQQRIRQLLALRFGPASRSAFMSEFNRYSPAGVLNKVFA